jgi:predicted NBD/HSP70 family sugar kinase
MTPGEAVGVAERLTATVLDAAGVPFAHDLLAAAGVSLAAAIAIVGAIAFRHAVVGGRLRASAYRASGDSSWPARGRDLRSMGERQASERRRPGAVRLRRV